MEQQRTVIGRRERNVGGPRWPLRSQEKGAIMKLATLGLATALVFTGTYALAQSSGGSAGGSSAMGGAATSGTTTGSSTGGTTSGNATGGTADTGMTNNAGSAAAGRNSGLNPSGNTLLNPSPSGSTLTPAHPARHWQIILADNKKPRLAGLFHQRPGLPGSTSSLPAASCISRRRASPIGQALRSPARWRRARRWRDRESASSPPRSRRRPWPRRSVSR